MNRTVAVLVFLVSVLIGYNLLDDFDPSETVLYSIVSSPKYDKIIIIVPDWDGTSPTPLYALLPL